MSITSETAALVANLVSGALLLLIPVAMGAWPLALIGAAYVGAASLFLAAVYARAAPTVRHEALAWAVPWLGAVVVWATIIGAVQLENTASHYLSSTAVGLVLGTLSFLGWQLLALAARQFLAWRAPGPA